VAHRHTARVTFHDADPAGIVFFSRFFEYAHDAFETFMRAGGLPLEDVLAKREIGLPLGGASAEFKRPLRHGDAFTVVVKVKELREKVFVLEHTIEGPSGETCAIVTTTHVCISIADKRARALPQDLLAVLTPHQG
jgi:YbgC/YbaW family acyl-CoA thioester hydrolase